VGRLALSTIRNLPEEILVGDAAILLLDSSKGSPVSICEAHSGGVGSSREMSSSPTSKGVSPAAVAPEQRSERKQMRETCSSCIGSSPNGKLPTAAATFAYTAVPPRSQWHGAHCHCAAAGSCPQHRRRTSGESVGGRTPRTGPWAGDIRLGHWPTA
jgi:hypothetical protein